jgi:hypothetical protein
MPTDQDKAGEKDPRRDTPHYSEEDLRHEYNHRLAVIRSFEATAKRIETEQRRPLLMVLFVALIMSLLVSITPLMLLTGELGWPADSTFLLYAVLSIFGSAACISILLAARRRQKLQRFELETIMSMFQREMTRTWARLDLLEKRNRSLRSQVRRARSQAAGTARGEQHG